MQIRLNLSVNQNLLQTALGFFDSFIQSFQFLFELFYVYEVVCVHLLIALFFDIELLLFGLQFPLYFFRIFLRLCMLGRLTGNLSDKCFPVCNLRCQISANLLKQFRLIYNHTVIALFSRKLVIGRTSPVHPGVYIGIGLSGK